MTAENPLDPRRAQIVEAARDAFFATGFANTTMDGVARAAKVSKQTLYRHFHDKAALFEAVVALDMSRFRDPPDLTRDERPAEAVLFEAARWIYDNHVSAPTLAMNRILIAAAAKFGPLATQHYEYRFQSGVAWVADYIKTLAERGPLVIPDPMRAAVRFMLMASEGSGFVLGQKPMALAEREAVARRTVNLFIHGLRAEAG